MKKQQTSLGLTIRVANLKLDQWSRTMEIILFLAQYLGSNKRRVLSPDVAYAQYSYMGTIFPDVYDIWCWWLCQCKSKIVLNVVENNRWAQVIDDCPLILSLITLSLSDSIRPAVVAVVCRRQTPRTRWIFSICKNHKVTTSHQLQIQHCSEITKSWAHCPTLYLFRHEFPAAIWIWICN